MRKCNGKMFRFEHSFQETLQQKYRQRPVTSERSGTLLRYSIPNLILSIEHFINSELQKLDDELYKIFRHKTNRGYGKDNFYRLFKRNNLGWNPKRDLIDLLCYYAFDHSYERSVLCGLMQDNLAEFRSLKTERTSVQPEPLTLANKIESKLLLNYYEKKVELAINSLEEFDISLSSFDKYDLQILKQIQPLRESLGEIHWDIIENRFFTNPDIVRGLKIITPIENVIVGFFILYPITKNCQSQIEKGEILKSDDFGLVDICNDFKSSSAIYISLVFAINRYSKAFLLLKLKDELLAVLSRYPNINAIYVRPATEDGLRNILKNKFTRLKNSPTIYYQKPEFILNKE